jgi:hypothetical protein
VAWRLGEPALRARAPDVDIDAAQDLQRSVLEDVVIGMRGPIRRERGDLLVLEARDLTSDRSEYEARAVSLQLLEQVQQLERWSHRSP